MGLPRSVSEIDGDFSQKLQNFPTRDGIPLELGIGARVQKKLESWGYRAEKEVWRYLQPSVYNTPTWRTDRQTDEHVATAKTALAGVARVKSLTESRHEWKHCMDSSVAD